MTVTVTDPDFNFSELDWKSVSMSLQTVQGAFVKIGDVVEFKGSLVESLENRRSSENQKPPENPHKSGVF